MKLQIEEITDEIGRFNSELEDHFSNVLRYQPELTRKIVSFQDNKNLSFYRWYKYKEAFSASLVDYFLKKYDVSQGVIFDPFAGIGTTLFASALMGYDSEGIELLPIGQEIISNRAYAQFEISHKEIRILETWISHCPWETNREPVPLNCLRITKGAYPPETEQRIGQYLSELKTIQNKKVSRLLFFALLCILESVSYTRKDGQYLRWDYRSGRGNGSNSFDKGRIEGFDQAICNKLKQILQDIKNPANQSLFYEKQSRYGKIKLHAGSCLDILPVLKEKHYQAIITSPPYCNRYDYTRTYALEHAMLGIGEKELIDLRQAMLCCTVENKTKEISGICDAYKKTEAIFQEQRLIHAILFYLEDQKSRKNLNNNGIPRMVRGYFSEMTAVLSECYRILDNHGYLFMVNDNVRYAGVCIPVDLILSKIAESIGFEVENILILPQAKGNSSQQMGGFGRQSLRKCVYVWRKA
mgnify:CR=1 FL=1